MSEDKWLPTQHGNTTAYKPQWKHTDNLQAVVNKRMFKMEGGDDWTDVAFSVNRNQAEGIPYPWNVPGILETIHLCGYEQAHALAWNFAAHVAAAGGEIQVRIVQYELVYDIKARELEVKL